MMDMRRPLRGCAGFLFAVAVAATAFAAQPGFTSMHKPAPEFVRADLSQQPIDLHAYRGQVVLLAFWATWCAPCQLEMPHFVAWQRQYGSKGLQIIAISMDDDAQPVRRLLQQRHVNYPVVMGDVKLAELYGGVMGLPVTFLIDRDGMVAARFKGESNLNLMRNRMLQLLNEH